MRGRIFVATAVILAVASTAFAFDGNRKGFILGGAAGVSMTSFTQELTGTINATSDRENKFGFGTDFKIGYAPNEQFMIYYVNRVAWFSLDVAAGGSATIANAVGLVGISYYVGTTSPGVYILGLVGLSSWSAPFEDNAGSLSGFGIGGGVGYEFTPHWSIEATVNYGNPSDKDGSDELKTNAICVMVNIAGIAY